MTHTSVTREQWLQSAIRRIRPAISKVGLILPSTVHVSIGFPSSRALSVNQRVLGECWPVSTSADGNPHVFISPLISDGLRALDILIHELIHAAGIKGHGADFSKPATLLGLTGKMTHSVASYELTERLNVLLVKLGPYPYSGLDANKLRDERKKQGTRLLKSSCEDCGAIIRVTQKLVNDPGLPTCACGGQFEMES